MDDFNDKMPTNEPQIPPETPDTQPHREPPHPAAPMPNPPYSAPPYPGTPVPPGSNPYYYNAPGGQNYQTPPRPVREPNGMATASMVVGLFGFISNFCCCFPLGLILGIASIVLVILSKNGKPLTGYAIAGLILGILSIITSLLVCAYFVLMFSLAKDPQYAPMFNEMYNQIYGN